MNTPCQKPDAANIPEEPAPLKLMRQLVTLLLVVLIAGVVIIVTVLTIRLGKPINQSPLVLPEDTAQLTIPAEHTIETIGSGNQKILVITKDISNRQFMLIYDSHTLNLEKTIRINHAEPQ